MPSRLFPDGFVRDNYTGQLWELPQPKLLKENAPCCNAKRDEIGRLPIGFCGPECLRRPVKEEK